MTWKARIAIDPTVLAGKPVVRGTRLAVDLIVGLLGQGWSEGDILQNYPGLTRDDIAACSTLAKSFKRKRSTHSPAPEPPAGAPAGGRKHSW